MLEINNIYWTKRKDSRNFAGMGPIGSIDPPRECVMLHTVGRARPRDEDVYVAAKFVVERSVNWGYRLCD